MKKLSIAGLTVFLILSMASLTLAFGLFGDKKNEEAKVDVDGLSKRSTMLVKNVQSATISYAEGIILVQKAVGKKEDAEKLQQMVNNAKENKGDINGTKQLVGSVNNAVKDLDDTDALSKVNKEEAQKNLGSSILKIGIGLIVDGIAAKDAANLLKESQEALKQVSFASAGKVKEVIDVSQFVAQEVPPQANSLQKYSGKLVKYAKSNKIKFATQKEAQKQAELAMKNMVAE